MVRFIIIGFVIHVFVLCFLCYVFVVIECYQWNVVWFGLRADKLTMFFDISNISTRDRTKNIFIIYLEFNFFNTKWC